MPARLRPRPEVPESIVTLASEPMWTDKRGIAHHFGVSTRQVDLLEGGRLVPLSESQGSPALRRRRVPALFGWTRSQFNMAAANEADSDRLFFASGKCNNFKEFDEFIIGLEIETMFYSRTGEDAKAVRDELMSDRDGPERKKKYDRRTRVWRP